MNIFRIFDLITRVGSTFSLLGELITRLGLGGRILLPPPEVPTGDGSMSQDSSHSQGVEDEKPAEESQQG